jgi:hypothetical protein
VVHRSCLKLLIVRTHEDKGNRQIHRRSDTRARAHWACALRGARQRDHRVSADDATINAAPRHRRNGSIDDRSLAVGTGQVCPVRPLNIFARSALKLAIYQSLNRCGATLCRLAAVIRRKDTPTPNTVEQKVRPAFFSSWPSRAEHIGRVTAATQASLLFCERRHHDLTSNCA